MPAITLYSCPALSAWITVEQCRRNAELGRGAMKAKPGTVARSAGLRQVETCPDCPGVEAISRRDGIPPQTFTREREGSGKQTKGYRRISPTAGQITRSQRARARARGGVRMTNQATVPADITTAKEIGARIGLDPKTVRDALERAGVRPVRDGKAGVARLYKRSDVEEWLRDRKAKGGRHTPERAKKARATRDTASIVAEIGEVCVQIEEELQAARAQKEVVEREIAWLMPRLKHLRETMKLMQEAGA